jgi:hypothetical protein
VSLTVGLDSYCDLATLQDRLMALGYGDFLDVHDQSAIESFARQAVLVLDTMVTWRGAKAEPDQPLQWPRTGTDRDGLAFDGTPGAIVDAEVMLCAAAADGPLLGSTGGNDPNRRVVAEHTDDAAIE